MKYRLTEEQLNSLITESTIRILREASEDEGIGGAIGKGLGWLARKTANGFKDFGKNFGQQWGGQAQGQGQGQANNTGTEQQSLTQMQQTIQTLSKQLASLQQIVNNGGGNRNAAGEGNTANGGNAADGGNAENGGNAAGGVNQSIDQAAIAKAHGATRKPNRTVPAKQKAAGGGQNNKAYDDKSDEDLANTGMLSGGK